MSDLDMKETMERVAVDDYYESRGKVCWHCQDKKICECISCASESGPGECVICSGKAKWSKFPSERANAPQANAIMKRRFRDYLRRAREASE